jgi:hypothetical protein
MTWLVRIVRSLGVAGAVTNARVVVDDYRRGISLANELAARVDPVVERAA